MDIYEKIYDIVAENLYAAGRSFEYQKSTFLLEAGSAPNIVDVASYLDLPDSEFFQAIYVAVYKRLPEKKVSEKWDSRGAADAAEYRKKVLKKMVNSSVAAINHVRFVNNPYFEQRLGMRSRLLGMLYGLTDKSSLRQWGKKMPQPIQKIIRKVFL